MHSAFFEVRVNLADSAAAFAGGMQSKAPVMHFGREWYGALYGHWNGGVNMSESELPWALALGGLSFAAWVVQNGRIPSSLILLTLPPPAPITFLFCNSDML